MELLYYFDKDIEVPLVIYLIWIEFSILRNQVYLDIFLYAGIFDFDLCID